MGSSNKRSIRHQYEDLGVDRFYTSHGGDYVNPHEDQLRIGLKRSLTTWLVNKSIPTLPETVMDLACGSGEVTRVLQGHPLLSQACTIFGVDPYTSASYQAKTSCTCFEYTFEQLATEQPEHLKAALIICSYALHLVDTSYLHGLLQYFASAIGAQHLIVVTPHKNPQINESMGWELVQELRHPECRQRYRLYRKRQ